VLTSPDTSVGHTTTASSVGPPPRVHTRMMSVRSLCGRASHLELVFDYIGEPTPYPWPAKSSYFGIVDTAGFPKRYLHFYQSHWTDDPPMVHVLPHCGIGSAGTTVTVFV